MTRVTRSRQAASSVSEITVKNTAKRTVTGAVTKKSIGKTRSNLRKVSNQDENAVPVSQVNKISKAKDSKAKAMVLGAKLLATKDAPVQNAVLTMKSPVLRDRTNTTNELVKVDAVSKVSAKIPLDAKKKPPAKRTTRNTKKQSAAKADISVASIEKYTVKLPRVQAAVSNTNSSFNKTADLPSKETAENVLGNTDINENFDKSQDRLVLSKSSLETTPANKRSLKRKNISLEDVEKLLNEDNDEVVESHETSDHEEKESVHEEEESVHEEEAKKEDQKTKKFFKHKGIEEETKPVMLTKNNQAKKGRATKKTKNNDSTFSPRTEGPRQSTKPERKKLRTRVAKDYCETSRLSKSKVEEKKDEEQPTENHQKGVPIYKTIKLSQEESEEKPDEIYEFHASQDDGQKGKKRKKTVKRPAVKRAKKTTNLPFGSAPLPKKKPAKTVSKNVQLKLENKNEVNTNAVPNEKEVDAKVGRKENTADVETNCMVPDDFPEIGDSTLGEVPAIKIVSVKNLEGSSKFRLTTTPAAPKTAVSGLKVFGPKTHNTAQSNQLTKMANHSLIRESMSPIKKVNDDFDVGSPWRAVDAFDRVKRLVQSTPQINRQAPQRLHKPVEHIAQLNKKSFGSEETIHLSKAGDNTSIQKSPIKERSFEEMSTIMQDEPRKFGTVISNKSSSKSASPGGLSNNSTIKRSPPQGTSLQSATPASDHKSPAKAISPPSADPNLPVNYKKLDLEDPTMSFDNKENISPKTSPKKKIVAPSPFRFEKIRSSKRIAAIASTSKSPEKASPTRNQEPDPEAGPSWLDKPRTATMKQTNLNNFLNLDEMPESANISTPHGIFDDVCSTPVSGRKPRKFIDEANIQNAFGFDDFDSDDTPSVESASHVKIATEADVKNSVKGKLFPKARVKSNLPSRISGNTVKTLLKDVLKKKVVEKVPEIIQEQEDSDASGTDNESFSRQFVNYKESEEDKKKIVLDAISFSDTFDVLSENGEELKVPEELPLFVDLEPAHFTQPPRKSYNKRKRNVCFDEDRYESSDEEEEHEKKKTKKKKCKESYLQKEERKRMEDWVKNVNKTFDEIEDFDLVVE